ncbi:MAG TPA: haloacid dehalogenase [Synergistaceae bacterium]|nr:haloacid dehalogenase [Synergistaceae bacterium]
MRKLLVTDIDKTLSRGETVAPEVCEACSRLRRGGWDIMVATGRVLTTARPHILAVGSEMPAIVYDGARVMDVATAAPLFETSMSPGLVLDVLEATWNARVELQVMGDEAAFCRVQDVTTRAFFSSADLPVQDALESPRALEGIFRVIFFGQPEIVRDLSAELSARFAGRAEVVLSGDRFLDVLPAGVSKGAALMRFLKGLPERPDILVAAGDHHNDLALFEAADVVAAPEDAAEEIVGRADIIMPSVARHGFALLADYLLQGDVIGRPFKPVVLL